MSFEQPLYGSSISGGEPPTPTRTPTSPNFFLNSLETPKPNVRFHDPFSPWTPAFSLSPAPQRSFQPSSPPSADGAHAKPAVLGNSTADTQRIEDQKQFALSALSTPLQSITRLEKSRADTGASGATSASSARAKSKDAAEVQSAQENSSKSLTAKTSTETVRSASSMQTPPPTSTSISRREAQEVQNARSMTASNMRNMASSDLSHNHQEVPDASTQVDQSTLQFPNLQFSPDGLSFANIGPATAPVYPQHRLFWDPQQSTELMSMDLSMDDSFMSVGLGLQRQLEPFVTEHSNAIPSTQPSGSVGLSSGSVGNTNHVGFALPRHTLASNQNGTSSSTTMISQGSSRGRLAATGVNPSVLFSSPSRQTTAAAQKVQDDALKPYAHQLQDAEIEKELRNRRPKRKRGEEIESPAVKAATQALREAEDGASTASSDDAVAASFGGPVRSHSRHLSRRQEHSQRPSALRNPRSREAEHHDVTQRRKRASITLSIDASGRASTQTTFVDEQASDRPHRQMDVDDESQSSDDSSSSSDDELVMSQPSSFVYPAERKKKLKSSRLGYGSSSHSQKSSATSTLGSWKLSNESVQVEDQGRTSKSTNTRKSGPSVHFVNRGSMISGPLNPEESEGETVVETDDDKGNAQAELKKLLSRRPSHKVEVIDSAATSFAQNSVNALPTQIGSLRNLPLAYSVRSTRNFPSNQTLNISPTTITDPSMTTPSTGHQSAVSNGTTRCICNNPNGEDQLMVQCESCKNWLHARCIGLHEFNIPEVYLCVSCTGSTPNVRRGRIREATRAAMPPSSSPLAYKSYYDL